MGQEVQNKKREILKNLVEVATFKDVEESEGAVELSQRKVSLLVACLDPTWCPSLTSLWKLVRDPD